MAFTGWRLYRIEGQLRRSYRIIDARGRRRTEGRDTTGPKRFTELTTQPGGSPTATRSELEDHARRMVAGHEDQVVTLLLEYLFPIIIVRSPLFHYFSFFYIYVYLFGKKINLEKLIISFNRFIRWEKKKYFCSSSKRSIEIIGMNWNVLKTLFPR